MKKNVLSLLLLVFCVAAAFAQKNNLRAIAAKENRYRLFTDMTFHGSDTLVFTFDITSLSIDISLEDTYDDAFIISGKDTFALKEDTHFITDTTRSSGLVIFPRPVRQFVFYKPNIRHRFYYHFFNSGTTPALKNRQGLRQEEGCVRPITIDQSVWREGLPVPDYKPSASLVKHMIVHHSEGRNDTTTDYTYVVRQIYLFHTDGRGWNDIGYNFLISQNGNIYEGREGFGIANEEDVVGAHLCGKNTGTMGICLLGNYQTAQPTAPALTSLKKLMRWKLYKNKLNPMGIRPHPNTYSALLPQVAGHRDGCGTVCPGANLYEALQSVRLETDTLVYDCGGVIPPPPVAYKAMACNYSSTVVLTATGTFNGFFRWYEAPDTTVALASGTDSLFVINHLQENATYYVSAVNASGESSKTVVTITVKEVSMPAIAGNKYEDNPVLILPGDKNAGPATPALSTSTTYQTAMVADGCETTEVAAHTGIYFRLYPNPTTKNIFLTTGTQFITSIHMIDTQGKKWQPLYVSKAYTTEIDVSNIPSGIYILSASTVNNVWVKEKVIIQKTP